MASSNVQISAPLEVVEQPTTPAVPDNGNLLIYPKTDGKWYVLTPSGVESPFLATSDLVAYLMPYYIDSATTFVVPDNIQMLFALPIDCDGYIEVDGLMVEV